MQKIRRKPSQKMRRRRIADDLMVNEPKIWFLMEMGGELMAGHVTHIWAENWTVDYLMDDGSSGEMDVEDFIEVAMFEDEEDIEQMFDILDHASEVEDGSGEEEDHTVWTLGGYEAGSASFEKISPVKLAKKFMARMSARSVASKSMK